MAYKDNFVAVVKCNGEVLREIEGYVTLPFGSEYSILMKNLDSRKAVVDISIDGKDILDSSRLIIYPNSNETLKGFMKGDTIKNKFKFIQKTDKIKEHRGDRIDDGMIRIEVKFEKVVNPPFTIYYKDWLDSYTPTYPTYYSTSSPDSYSYFTASGNTGMFGDGVSCNFVSEIETDEGITVKGSEENQSFRNESVGTLESTSSIIIIQLRGTNSREVKVTKPITIKGHIECETCGTISRSFSKYCFYCGTYLQ